MKMNQIYTPTGIVRISPQINEVYTSRGIASTSVVTASGSHLTLEGNRGDIVNLFRLDEYKVEVGIISKSLSPSQYSILDECIEEINMLREPISLSSEYNAGFLLPRDTSDRLLKDEKDAARYDYLYPLTPQLGLLPEENEVDNQIRIDKLEDTMRDILSSVGRDRLFIDIDDLVQDMTIGNSIKPYLVNYSDDHPGGLESSNNPTLCSELSFILGYSEACRQLRCRELLYSSRLVSCLDILGIDYRSSGSYIYPDLGNDNYQVTQSYSMPLILSSGYTTRQAYLDGYRLAEEEVGLPWVDKMMYKSTSRVVSQLLSLLLDSVGRGGMTILSHLNEIGVVWGIVNRSDNSSNYKCRNQRGMITVPRGECYWNGILVRVSNLGEIG